MLAFAIVQLLLGSLAYSLVDQTDVPAILLSYKLSPGIAKYSLEDTSDSNLSLEKFSNISKQLLSNCNSDAYVFINLPGITKFDFVEYKEELISLQRYISSASTAVGFDRIETPSNFTFNELIRYVSDTCRIDELLSIEGESADEYQPYIDAARRVVRIEYSTLPEEEDLRREAIIEFDKSLRTFLAQIPSPAHTIVLTALSPSQAPEKRLAALSRPMFPEVLLDPAKRDEVEKNDHDLKVPRSFNEPRPKFSKPESRYMTVFDSGFIKENYNLIRLIVTSLIGFLLIQLFAFKPKREHNSQLRARRETPKKANPTETASQGEPKKD